MAPLCVKCNKTVQGKDFLRCSKCKKIYDIQCAGRSKIFQLMTIESKNVWICPPCHSGENTSNKDSKKGQYIPKNTDSGKITIRKKTCPQKLPGNHSLSPQILTQKSKSTESITRPCFINDSSQSLDESLSKSLELSVDPDIVSELKLQIKTLKTELASTENELQNVIIEKNEFLRQIDKLNREISTLKNICKAPQQIKKSRKSTSSSSIEITSPGPSAAKTLTLESNIKTLQNELEQTQQEICNLNEIITGLQQELESCKFKSYSRTQEKEISLKKNIINTSIDKHKLCIISSCTRYNILRTMDRICLYDNSERVHYITPNVGIDILLKDIEKKLAGYTKRDYCIIIIGETDFLSSKNYMKLVESMRQKLQDITSTNIIIAAPTYICGAPLYNTRIEVFNTILNRDLTNFKYGLFFDSNQKLTLDHFSYFSGKLRNSGVQNILKNIAELIYFLQTSISNNTEDLHYNEDTENDDRNKSMFFR